MKNEKNNKKILANLFEFFKKFLMRPGIEIVRYTSQLITFSKKYKNFNLYNEGLKRSKNENTDNFLKKNRFLNIIQTCKHILSQSEVHDFAECGCWKRSLHIFNC